MTKNNKKGFTLAELLIVVAIIGILVAISIPIFTSQLNKAKDATNQANARSLYAQLVADYMDDSKVDNAPSSDSVGEGASATITMDGNSYKFTGVGSSQLSMSYSSDESDTGPVVTYTHWDGSAESWGSN